MTMYNVLDKIKQLQLNNLSEDWVQERFDSVFMDFDEIPPDFEYLIQKLDLKAVFLEIMQAIDQWLNDGSCKSEDKSWARLSTVIPHRELLALLAYYIDYGNKNVLNKECRYNALFASRLYYKLLFIPGYKAYNVYHSQLFVQTLACLSFPKTISDNESNYDNIRELTRELNQTLKALQDYVLDLNAVIKSLQLNPSDINYEEMLSHLIDITGGPIIKKLNVDKAAISNLSSFIYKMIEILICHPNGNPNPEAIRILYKCLLPKLIAASADSRAANNVVRASYVTFSALLLSKYGKAALPGYITLLQHLCYVSDGLERAEHRTTRTSLVVGLMSLLPTKHYRDLINWVLVLSTVQKIAHRQMAVEVLSTLLSNDSEDQVAAGSQSQSESDSGIHDSSASVRTNSFESTSAANMMEQEDPNAKAESVAGAPDENKELGGERDEGGAEAQQKQCAPHERIVRALYDRAHDVSSAVRMRALVALNDCVDSHCPSIQDAIKKLNGDGETPRLVALAGRCVFDERAVVRRAAAALVHGLIVATRRHSPNDLAILVSLCRDASIIVRLAAITALGDLVVHLPGADLLDAFLTGPMHQLSDPEVKIQEQVVTQLQHVLFERLLVYTPGQNEDKLPWIFLAGVVRKNMRPHLQKACTILHNLARCINYRVVEQLSTHLGAVDGARDLQVLVLLTSMARHVEYTNLGFLLDYYYKFDENVPDVRVHTLTLEMFTLWSRWLSASQKEKLRAHLLRKISTAPNDDGCRLVRANLAAHLDQSNLDWATEFMKLSISRALSDDECRAAESVRAVDLSLVAPEPPPPELLQMLLQRLNDRSAWGEGQSLSECLVGVGRLCLRSRETAAASAPPIAVVLRDDTAPVSARVSALLTLTDICIRYACIVEPLLDSMSQCVNKEVVPPLRRAAARALTRLLLGGYLRLRSPLYYRYCALLADEDHDVREPAEFYVGSCLTNDAIYYHFVDCVLFYNGEDGGNLTFDARQLIYDVMLQRLSLVQKLNVQCRLAREVLQHAADLADEDSELPPALYAALLDTITLLCGPRMRLPKKPPNSGEVADVDDLQERVTTNIVTHKMKRTVAEVLVPAVLRLYARMRQRGGQLAAYLVRFSTDLLVDYRQEIEELIETEEELVQRIQHFKETIGLELPVGNSRNLVTTSAPPDPDTPRSVRKRPALRSCDTAGKRVLKL